MTDAIPEEIITTPAQLKGLVDHLRAIGRFAFDTEFVSEETFEPVLCLIQVATRERLAVIDPLAVRDVSPFWDVVLDPAVEVVMHAAGEDLRICLIRTRALPRRVFDVQIAAGLAGLNYPLSLVNLVGQVLGISLAGSETRTDWRHRPLSAAQLNYALDDVRHLLDLADHFIGRLAQLSRTAWAEAEIADFIESIAQRADEDRWRRLPGLHQLSRRSLEMARRLAEWREDEARRQNRPLRQVVRDDLLVAIAKRQPRNSPRPRSPARLQPPGALEPQPRDPGDPRPGPGGPGSRASRAARAARRAPGPLHGDQPALGGPGAVLRAKPARRLAGGQRRRSQAPGPLAPGRPRRFAPPGPPAGLARRALRPALARRARRQTGPARRRPRERVPRRTRTAQAETAANRMEHETNRELFHQLLWRLGSVDGGRADQARPASITSSWRCGATTSAAW